MSGDLISGRYRTEQEIGRGGMGIVFRAYDTLLDRVVALKMLLSESTRPESHSSLIREARAASTFCHPGIAAVYDFVEDSGTKFIVYEFVEGGTLRRVLTDTRLQTPEILDVGIQVAGALSAAHQHGIVHRDIKPENIMLGPRHGNEPRPVKILDFGLAKHLTAPPFTEESGASSTTVTIQTSPGQIIGTISYMAPEQLQGEAVDARTDIHALGLVLYEMAGGANPFDGKTPSSTIANILDKQPPELRLSNPATPAELDRILQKCLRKDPRERYQSALELLTDLRVLRTGPTASSKPLLDEESLFGRIFGFVGKSAYRHWEITHLRMTVWCLILIAASWRFASVTPGASAQVLFFSELICSVTVSCLSGALLYFGAFDIDSFPGEIRRISPWIRALGAASGLLACIMAGITMTEHPILAMLLAFLGMIMILTVVVFKPSIDRKVLSRVV